MTVGGAVPQYNFATDLTMSPGQEREIVHFSGCGPLNVDLYAKTEFGFASVHESRAPGCNGAGRFIKSVIYRPSDNFSGRDSVTLASSGHSPVVFRVTIHRIEPQVAAAEEPVKAVVFEAPFNEKLVEPQAGQKSVEALLAEGKAMSPDVKADMVPEPPTKPSSGGALMKKLLDPSPHVKPIDNKAMIKEASLPSTAAKSDDFAAGTRAINMQGIVAGGVEMEVVGQPGKTITTNPSGETDLFIVKMFQDKGEAEVRLNGRTYFARAANLTIVDKSGCRVSLYSHLTGHDCPKH